MGDLRAHHRGDGREIHGAHFLVAQQDDDGAQHRAGFHRRVHTLVVQLDVELDGFGVKVLADQAANFRHRRQGHGLGAGGLIHRHLGHGIEGGEDGGILVALEEILAHVDKFREASEIIRAGFLVVGVFGVENHAQKLQVVVGGGGNEAALGGGGEAGLDAGGLGIVVVAAAGVSGGGDELVGGVELALLAYVGGGDGVLGRVGNLPEFGVGHGGLDDERQILGGGVVILVVEAVGVGKVGAGAAQLRGLFVHQRHEGVHRAGYVLGDDVAGLVGRGHHDAVEQILEGDDLSGLESDGAAVLVEVFKGGLRDGDLVVEVAVL